MPGELQDEVRFVQQYHQRQPHTHTPAKEPEASPAPGPMAEVPPENRKHGQWSKGGGHPVGLDSGPKRVGQIKEENRQAKTQHVPQGQRTVLIHRCVRCRWLASQSPETHERQNDPHQEHRIHETQGGCDEFGQELRPETPRLIQAAPLLEVGHGDPTVATIPKNHRQDRNRIHG